ncbi:hypothetical protein HBI23_050960 [Parastagonospora nodorum]|nr:hypothetical protein HBI12_027700 [Parastagonospora nodorum]KAH5686094.1 hypothetical protein HBI23_050960 [Parastagonospora nodorum]
MTNAVGVYEVRSRSLRSTPVPKESSPLPRHYSKRRSVTVGSHIRSSTCEGKKRPGRLSELCPVARPISTLLRLEKSPFE